jgi:molybdenum cofactor synthesis domain-containing protein
MLTYQEAVTQILATVRTLSPTDIPLLEALGLVLAEDVTAPYPVPAFANSAMDGFAVRTSDIAAATERHPVSLPIVGEIAAGDMGARMLAPQTALRIMTGAPMPDGADTVVPVEDTEIHGAQVHIKVAYSVGRFVRGAGEDVAAGETVVTQGSLLRPAEIGMCAVAGHPAVQAYPRPRVAVISTGDELVEPGEALKSGQIYNSNAYALAAQVMEAGGVVIQRLHARDTPEDVRAAFDACTGCDVILTSGGVSVGEHDHVKAVFSERGTLDFWRVAIRPGKPLAFGRWNQTLFFGLPGNPVSSMVTFELFVRPALRQIRGLDEPFRATVQARLTTDARHETGRQSYQRAFVSQEGAAYLATPAGGQGSHQMRGMVAANALLVLPSHIEHIPAGETVTVLLLDSSVSL